MLRYLTLVNFRPQGIAQIGESPHRATAFHNSIEEAGGRVLGIYWTVGEFDGAVLFEVPDEETATALLLDLGRKSFVRTRTLRAWDAAEFEGILSRKCLAPFTGRLAAPRRKPNP